MCNRMRMQRILRAYADNRDAHLRRPNYKGPATTWPPRPTAAYYHQWRQHNEPQTSRTPTDGATLQP